MARIFAAMVLFCLLGPSSAQADVIWLLEDRYTANTLVQLTDRSGRDRTWTNHREGSVWGPDGPNTFRLRTQGVVEADGGPLWGVAAVNLLDLSNGDGDVNAWEVAVYGDREPTPRYRTHAEFNGYLAFAVSGGNSWLGFSTPAGNSPFTFVDLTTGATLRDSQGGGSRHTLLDGHMYGLTTFLSLSNSDDGWDAIVSTNADINPAPVPEPSGLLLFGTAMSLFARKPLTRSYWSIARRLTSRRIVPEHCKEANK